MKPKQVDLLESLADREHAKNNHTEREPLSPGLFRIIFPDAFLSDGGH
jgi:hypothetical protein